MLFHYVQHNVGSSGEATQQLAWLFGEGAQHAQCTCFLQHGADMNGLCQGFVTSDLRVLETVKELRLYPEVGGTGA